MPILSEAQQINAVKGLRVKQARKRSLNAKGFPGDCKNGVMPHEVGVFVRSEAQLDRARGAVTEAGVLFKVLDEHVQTMSWLQATPNRMSARRAFA